MIPRVVILGGGVGGTTVANRLARLLRRRRPDLQPKTTDSKPLPIKGDEDGA